MTTLDRRLSKLEAASRFNDDTLFAELTSDQRRAVSISLKHEFDLRLNPGAAAIESDVALASIPDTWWRRLYARYGRKPGGANDGRAPQMLAEIRTKVWGAPGHDLISNRNGATP